jgi:hypothetical protein
MFESRLAASAKIFIDAQEVPYVGHVFLGTNRRDRNQNQQGKKKVFHFAFLSDLRHPRLSAAKILSC